MAVQNDVKSEYARRLAARRARVAQLAREENLLANARLIIFLCALGIGGAAYFVEFVSWGWLTVPAAAFAYAVVLHDRTLRRLAESRAAAAHYGRCLARLEDRWAGTGVAGLTWLQTDHPYAADLDLFGEGSLFELLCTARTRAGEETLARWLCGPPAGGADEIRARQQAVEDLRGRLDLREDLAIHGGNVRARVLPETLIGWGEAPATLVSRRLRGWAWCVVALSVISLAAWPAAGAGPLMLASVAAAVTLLRTRARVQQVLDGLDEPRRELGLIAAVFERLERESFASPRLQTLQRAFQTHDAGAARCIRRLYRLTQWHEARYNQLFAVIAFFLAWDLHFALAFEAWRARHGKSIRQWLDALGQLEALSCLAEYAYERPGHPFPEIVEQGPLYVGVELGHPLLPAAVCVRNDVRLTGELQAFVVSGSNMSGKSTLLRTVGVNAVLAYMGAPVCARSLRISPLALGATLRIQDSLRQGSSRFYAEINRLRQILELTRGPLPVLFLLDEILHGTNSRDRGIGAAAILRSLIDAGAIGLVTTHDLALAAVAEELAPRAANVHFEDHIEDGRLAFDYRVRPGVVQKSNALELMRSVGLNV